MAFISNFVIISLFFSLFYFIGLLTFITDYEENKCDMTWMYEYPQFVKIWIPNGEKYPRYGLYAYSEGKFTEKARAMKFDGIPVLFVPGNAGSYKQVRSLASVALRKALSSRSNFHFDFFTVDLHSELSGLNGAVLNEQTSFLNESIHRILTLYPKTKLNSPESVILIGHSMGGVIAHGLMVNSEDRNIELLITLGSPHRRPSLSSDWYMAKYYQDLQSKANVRNMMDKTFITIGAGNYDRLVNSWLTNANSSSINVVATAVPGVWVSMDHACIVWCNQLVLAIIRAIFDSIDLKTQQLSTDHNFRLLAFKHHLLQNSGIKFRDYLKYREITSLQHRGEWREDLRRQFSIVSPKSRNQVNYYMIRLFDDPKHQALFVQAVNLQQADWIFACSANSIQGQSRVCEEAVHLSHRSEIAPSMKNKRRIFYMDLFRIKKRYPDFTHIVIRIMPSSEPVTLNFDVHNPKERLISVDLPSWYSLSRKVILKQTAPEALKYVLELPGLQHIIQHYFLYLEPIFCTTTMHQATAKLSLPWAHHDSNIFVTEGIKKPLVVRLHNSKPSLLGNSTAKVILTLDPVCQYTVSIRSSFIGMLSQLTRYYSPLLIANISAVILMTFYSQMLHLDSEGRCLNFQSALSINTKPYYLVTAAKLISRTLTYEKLADIFPMPDGQYLVNENLEFLILPLVMYVTAVGLTYLISVVFWSILVFSESTMHKFVVKAVTRMIGGAIKWSDWLLSALHKVPCIVAIILFSLGVSTCGGIALCLGLVYYFLKLTQMCQEYLEGLVFRFIKKIIYKFIGLFKRKKVDLATEKNSEIDNKSKIDAIKEKTDIKKSQIDAIKDQPGIDEKFEETTNKSEVESLVENDENDLKDNSDEDSDECKANSDGSGDNSESDVRLRKVELAAEVKPEEVKNDENRETKSKNGRDSIHFHFTIFLIWFIITAINIPSVLTWARNFHYNNTLSPDPSGIPGIALSICAIFLWQLDIPKANKLYYKEIGLFLYSMAVVCLVYAPISIYRLPYILATTIIVVTLHQLFGPEQSEEEEEETENLIDINPDPIDHINDIKTKLE